MPGIGGPMRSAFIRSSRLSFHRSFAPAGLVAFALAGAVSCSEAGDDSPNNESTGGSAAESAGGTTAGTGGVSSTGGADATGSGGDMGTGGVVDPNAPIQADPGDEGDGVFEDPGPYPLSSEASGPIDDAPEGQLSSTQTFTSPEVYEGWTFDYQIFVPAQYEAGKPAALAVFQDGVGAYGGIGVMQMFENLIHSGDMPVTIVLFVSPGSGGRSENYDVVSDRYGRLLLEEMIPDVLSEYELVDDPNGWAIAGFSSGGCAAFTVAWFFPGNFRKVSTNSGSFVSIRTAHEFPQMILDTDPKPIRVSLRSGTNDLDNQFGSWLDANFAMADALEEQGYHYRFTHGTGGHDMAQAAKDMAEEWRWLWRGYSLPYYD